MSQSVPYGTGQMQPYNSYGGFYLIEKQGGAHSPLQYASGFYVSGSGNSINEDYPMFFIRAIDNDFNTILRRPDFGMSNLTFNAYISAQGTIFGNILTVGNVSSSLIPSADSVFDLGSPSNKWKHLYVDSIIASGSVGGSGVTNQVAFWTGSLEISGSNNLYWDSAQSFLGIKNATPEFELDTSGSIQSRHQILKSTNALGIGLVDAVDSYVTASGVSPSRTLIYYVSLPNGDNAIAASCIY
jgi:hypothetical protein